MTKMSLDVVRVVTDTNLLLIECCLGRYKEPTSLRMMSPHNCGGSINLKRYMARAIEIFESS
jgi:hypothetical protein